MFVAGNGKPKETAISRIEDISPLTESIDAQMQQQQPKNINDSAIFDKEAGSFEYLLTDLKFAENKKLWLQDAEFETLNKLIAHLRSTPTVFINHHYIRNILKTYFDQSYLKKLTETHRKIIVKAIFISAIIRFLILSMKDDFADFTKDQFVEKYPEFETVESKWELLALIRFERALSIALQYLQGKGNKQLLLSIAAHLEGSNMQYVTGGQPSPGTKRRVLIFERLSGVRPVKRAKRDESKKSLTPGKSEKGGKSRGRDDDDDESLETEDDASNPSAVKSGPTSASAAPNFAPAFAALDLLSKIASEQLEDLGH